jgi:hypothetical protein
MRAAAVGQLKRTIEEVVRDRIGDAIVESVEVLEDADSEGDAILRVRVVFDSSQGRPDTREVAGLVRHLRLRLDAEQEPRFPLMSFVSRKDVRKLSPEAA